MARLFGQLCVGKGRSRSHDQWAAVLIGPDQPWLNTNQFLDKLDQNLKAKMGAYGEAVPLIQARKSLLTREICRILSFMGANGSNPSRCCSSRLMRWRVR